MPVQDSGWGKEIKKLQELTQYTVEVGYKVKIFDPTKDVGARAVVQHFGAKIPVTQKMRGWLAANLGVYLKKNKKFIIIPPRPFLKETINRNKRHMFEYIESQVWDMLTRYTSRSTILNNIGKWIKKRMQITIKEGGFKPNVLPKPQPPLIKTGQMMRKVGIWIVKDS